MPLLKKIKDYSIKFFWGNNVVPRGLYELDQYFRLYGPIDFKYEKGDGATIAISTNFRNGSIVTSGKTQKELDKNIKDAILTSFGIPSSYSREVNIFKQNENKQIEYALA